MDEVVRKLRTAGKNLTDVESMQLAEHIQDLEGAFNEIVAERDKAVAKQKNLIVALMASQELNAALLHAAK